MSRSRPASDVIERRTRHHPRPLPHHRQDRRGRHGGGVSSARYQARPGGADDPTGRFQLVRGATGLSGRDLQEIRGLHDRWIASELKGDASGVLRLCADDVQWLVPGSGLVVGKEAGRELLAASDVEIRDIQTADIEIRGNGNFAYKTSTYRTRWASTGSSELGVTRGTHLWILRKTDGEWRVTLVTWQPATD